MGEHPLPGLTRVAFVHAHPDDETLSTGALIADLVSRGGTAYVLTGSRGERGDIVPGPLSHLRGTPELTSAREAELRGALAALGVADHAWLGQPPARSPGAAPRRYLDSGMRWVRPGLAGPAEDADPASLTSADLAEVAADIGAWLRGVAPEAVVTYDLGGGYGHPDHVRIREATALACGRLALPLLEIRTGGEESADPPDAVRVDLPQTLPVVQAALRAHASQVRVDGDHVVHSGGQREPIVTRFALRQVPPDEGTAADRV